MARITAKTGSQRVTILDVAAQANVSRQTVTRAINDMPGITADTKERVLAAARNLGYRPSRFGRGLVRQEHRTLGLVVDELVNPYYPELASAVVSRARHHGWTVLLLDGSGIQEQREMITTMADQFDALLGYLAMSRDELNVLLPGVPVVKIDAGQDTSISAGIEFDLKPAMNDAITHLLAQGSSRPIMLDSPPPISARAKLFRQVTQEHGVDPAIVYANSDGIEASIQTTEEILYTIRDFDAIMCFNDIYAFGVLKALHQMKIHVPHDIRVIGIDGLKAGTYVTPRLTTLTVDMIEVATAALDLVFGQMDGNISADSARQRVQHRLTVREST